MPPTITLNDALELTKQIATCTETIHGKGFREGIKQAGIPQISKVLTDQKSGGLAVLLQELIIHYAESMIVAKCGCDMKDDITTVCGVIDNFIKTSYPDYYSEIKEYEEQQKKTAEIMEGLLKGRQKMPERIQ